MREFSFRLALLCPVNMKSFSESFTRNFTKPNESFTSHLRDIYVYTLVVAYSQNNCKGTKKPARKQYVQANIYEMYPKIYVMFPISVYFV